MGVTTQLFSAHFEFTKSKLPKWLPAWTTESWLGGRARESMRQCRAGTIHMLPMRPLILFAKASLLY